MENAPRVSADEGLPWRKTRSKSAESDLPADVHIGVTTAPDGAEDADTHSVDARCTTQSGLGLRTVAVPTGYRAVCTATDAVPWAF